MSRAVDARRHLTDPRDRRSETRLAGRAWVNGIELGGARRAFAHLVESYD